MMPWFFIAAIFQSAVLFSQVKVVKPLTAKTVAPAPTADKVIHGPVGLIQKATVDIVVGDDGKDATTKLGMILYDDNNRMAAYYGDNQGFNGTSGGEYSSGQSVTLLTTLVAGEPQAQPNDPSRFTFRNSFFSEFTFSGGSLNLSLHNDAAVDVWKIKSLSLSLYFENDPRPLHTITCNNVTITSSEFAKQLKFDKQFNAIQ